MPFFKLVMFASVTCVTFVLWLVCDRQQQKQQQQQQQQQYSLHAPLIEGGGVSGTGENE